MGIKMSEQAKEYSQFLIKLAKIMTIIVALIVILTTAWYVVSDRFNVIAMVKDNGENIQRIDIRVSRLENENNDNLEIKYNLKRLLEKNGLKWELFNK